MADTPECATLQEQVTVQDRVTIQEPAAGWTRAAYDRELNTYVAEHGRTPQTVTMHPDTAAALGLSDELVDPIATQDIPLLVTSLDYDRDTITFYY